MVGFLVGCVWLCLVQQVGQGGVVGFVDVGQEIGVYVGSEVIWIG